MYFARQMDKGLIEIGWRSDTATSDWQSQTILKKSVITKYKTSNYILHIINGYLYFPKLYIMYTPFLLVCKYENTLLWNPSYSSMNSILKDKTIVCMDNRNFVSHKVELYLKEYFFYTYRLTIRSLIIVN